MTRRVKRSKLRRLVEGLPTREQRRALRLVLDVNAKATDQAARDRSHTWEVPPLLSEYHEAELTLPDDNPPGMITATPYRYMPGLGQWSENGPSSAWGTTAQYVVGLVLEPGDGGSPGAATWTMFLEYVTQYGPVSAVGSRQTTSSIILTKGAMKLDLGAAIPPAPSAWDSFAQAELPLLPTGAARVIVVPGPGAVDVPAGPRTAFWGVYAGPSPTLPLRNPYRATVAPVTAELVGSRSLPDRT